MHAAIETHGLRKSLGGKPVIRGLDLSVPAGRVYGFLGPNGAGKTTAMRLLLGLMPADAGEVRLLGQPLGQNRLSLLRQVGSFIESPALYDHRSGRANLDVARRLLGLPASEVDRVLEVVDMRADAARRVSEYSLGMRQRMALARSLLGSPKLLLLDEPTNGLDPDGIADMRALVRDLPARMDCTVLISSHLLGEVEQVADHVGLLRKGRLAMQGPLQDLLGSGRRIALEVDDAARATSLLTAEGLAAHVSGGATLTVDAPPDGELAPLCARINRILVEAGLAVSSLGSQRLSLEDLYKGSAAPTEEAQTNERKAA
ncbi:ATP-binding cassette domain-containing protein [Paraurantiacibacter namhicola]|uniref:Putative ABC transporter ATP-binding protein YxlF n=1 Tax=Paraurantiacibacter namhicola TaxID=645517 RepID=A0A1C7DBC5_9SPHN|nr:ATP-binding cassette domain-containing protein [Paraurantiacibacter namhicola]ANU08611.1 putative ABC transporter ATP-binding protein YxlF [Paraurantiacibacter namhicola]